MRFTLVIDDWTWLGWSDDGDSPIVTGSPPALVARVERASWHGLRMGGYVVDLSQPHTAYRSLIGALRERAGHAGPIVFTGWDDDGNEIPFVPEPDAESDL